MPRFSAKVSEATWDIWQTRYPARNRSSSLSVKAGLRAKEIASLTWCMITDRTGNTGRSIRLQDKSSKGKSPTGRLSCSSIALKKVMHSYPDNFLTRLNEEPKRRRK
jgi:hypothetical protein